MSQMKNILKFEVFLNENKKLDKLDNKMWDYADKQKELLKDIKSLEKSDPKGKEITKKKEQLKDIKGKIDDLRAEIDYFELHEK